MKGSSLFVVILYSCLLIFSHLQLSQAGSFIISPVTIYGTSITVSASYPDFFRFDEPTNISVAITVNFYNESISAVNVTAIHVRLYRSSVNVNQEADLYGPTSLDSYADADWLSTDYYGSHPYPSFTPSPAKIEREDPRITSGSWNTQLTLSYGSTVQKEVQAKLFIQVTLYFIDVDGKIVWRLALEEFGYHWLLFSGEGEAPIITIYPKTTQQFWLFKPETIMIVIASLGLVLLGIGVIYIRRRKRKLSN